MFVKRNHETNQTMIRSKVLFLFVSALLCFASCKKVGSQQADSRNNATVNYERKWQQISAMEEKGLGKSILQQVDSVLISAIEENNTTQVFKALAYRSKYENQIEEESTYKILSQFELQISKASFPLKQLLHSATAELYYSYYNQNRWRFRQRTNTTDFDTEDLRTWSLQQILDKVDFHYQSSLSPKEDLLTLPLKSWKEILAVNSINKEDKQFDGGEYQPSAYDFLSVRALNYYKNNEGAPSLPIHQFKVDDYAVFAPVEEYIKLDITTNDTGSIQFKSARIFQQLLSAHHKDKERKVLLNFNLDRLSYFYANSTDDLKDSLYLNALLSLSDSYADDELLSEINYQIAKLYNQWGSTYSANDNNKEVRWYLKKAYEICKKHKDEKSFGGLQCRSLFYQLNKIQFNFITEQAYLPNQPILYQFGYRNVDSIYFKVVQIPQHFNQRTSYKEEEKLVEKALTSKTKRTWLTKLKNPKDFQLHHVELKTEGLSKGRYILIASNEKNPDPTKDMVAHSIFTVSSISFLSRSISQNNEADFYVLNRATGLPIQNATVHLFESVYKGGEYEYQESQVLKTDKKGHVNLSQADKSNTFQIFITHQADSFNLSNSIYLNGRSSRAYRNTIRTHFFTDRAIYRPGQIVYFKGLVIENGKHQKKLVSNHNAEVSLLNKNGELITSLKKRSNEYGSYEGSFVLPSSGLNGQYRIKDKNGSIFFSVEEYKRPTFAIKLDTSAEEQKINSTIHSRGVVESYSGVKLSNANIRYRVIRKASFPYWYYSRSILPTRNQKEIANGTTTTDENGAFDFSFLAQSDRSIPSSYSPTYAYEISIDATSTNGETQSLATTIHLSDQGLYLSLNIGDKIQLKDLKKLIVEAKNINNKQVESRAVLRLWKLTTPKTAKINKYWSQSDQSGLSNRQYQELFPSYPTKEERSIMSFAKTYEVNSGAIQCNEQVELFRSIQPGAYELEVSAKDGSGKEVKTKKRFILFDEHSNKPPYPMFYTATPLKVKGEPGDTARMLISTSLKKLRLLYEVEHKGKVVSQRFITLSNEQQRLSFPIEEKHRGDFHIHLTGVHSNRVIKVKKTISVPFTNKKLSLKLGTFRDKVQPGSKEKWTLEVTDNNGKPVSAELLAGMYDRSLDQFTTQDWKLSLFNKNYSQINWNHDRGFGLIYSRTYDNFARGRNQHRLNAAPQRIYPSLNWFGFYLGNTRRYYKNRLPAVQMSMSAESERADAANFEMAEEEVLLDDAPSEELPTSNESTKRDGLNPIRTDFRESVFFFPQLTTNRQGLVHFEFTMPDALTEWNFRALAHSKGLQIGTVEQQIKTQKELMVTPNFPRFFREGDSLTISASLHNLSNELQHGKVKLRFFDAFSQQQIDIFDGNSGDISFELFAGKSSVKEWKIRIPEGIKAINYRIEAHSQRFSDGEEKLIPVLLNRMLVTESMPMAIRGNQQKTFNFAKLTQQQSKTLSHESFVVEFTPNPAWYAIQALPYIASQNNECSEKVFSRFFTNALAAHIANSNPKISAVFESWKGLNSVEMTSKLMQNQELKRILIEETPWLQQAKSEAEQKKMIALLFDYNRMADEKRAAIQQLAQLQLPEGGWSWYKGMRANRYITQYIVSGIGHLKHLGVDIQSDKTLNSILNKAIQYLDRELQKDYDRLLSDKVDLEKKQINTFQIHYLYTRSFFLTHKITVNEAYNFYLKQATTYWLNQNLQMQGMIGLAVNRLLPNSSLPMTIKSSLQDRALITDAEGMYWKNNRGGYYWHNSAIETQALMIEFFSEIGKDRFHVEELRIWLLKQKQTQLWSNSKATALACYALLIDNQSAFSKETNSSIRVGNQLLEPSKQEVGTGYFKRTWNRHEVKRQLGQIEIEKQSDGISWGAAYWQYYDDLDQITSASVAELNLSKTMFKVELTENGETIRPISTAEIRVGDKIRIRLRIESKRDLEFVHIKDMRASGFEPTKVLSRRNYQDGLAYYESTKDASSNFFIDRLRKGVYVFEYDLRAAIAGKYSNGISSIQCHYAPEFNAHSKGIKVSISPQAH